MEGDVFIAFVNTFNLQYPNSSRDPIFPATTPSNCSYNNKTCYTDSLLRASVLGCTELAEVCFPTSHTCYNVWNPDTFENISSADWHGADEALLTMFGLNYSDFGSTLSTRHGFLLDVTRRITGNRISQSLDPEQWKLEVRRLFGMSLLRAKWEMLLAVRGTRASEPGYIDILPPNRRSVCRKFMFQAEGYKNISFVGILAAIFIPPLLGLEYKKKAYIEWLLAGIRELALFIWNSGSRELACILEASRRSRQKAIRIFGHKIY
jgi:hypothetical protein